MTNTTRRLFIGVPILPDQINGFSEMLKKLQIYSDKRNYQIKWTSPDNLHLTLQFLGNLNDEELAELIPVLDQEITQLPNFNLDIRNVDAFGSIEKGRLIWMGVRESQDLMENQNRIHQICKPFIKQEEEKEYKPHISVGRLRNQKHLRSLVEPFMRKKFGRVEVNQLSLFQSVLQNRNPVYKSIKTWNLESYL